MGNYFGCNYDESSVTDCYLKTRIQDLRDAVLCIGCIRFVLAISCYLGLVILVFTYGDGYWSSLLQVLLIIIIVPELILAGLLFFGAKKVCSGFYVGLIFLVAWNASGAWSSILITLIIIAIPITVICGLILFYGAMNEKVWALEIAIWLCMAIAAYNTVLGIMGLLYFVREGKKTVHFAIAAFFGLLAMSFFAVICHDIIIIYTLKRTILLTPPIPDMMYECC